MRNSRRIFAAFVGILIALILTGWWLWSGINNEMDPALDTLAKLQIQDRWSHPEMLKIRNMGTKAVPDLRHVLREKNNFGTKLIREAQKKWPKFTPKFARLDDNLLRERLWVACQAIQVLGPAARPAAPELIDILKAGDLRDLNAATMALYAIGSDTEICDQLARLFEQNALGEYQRSFAVRTMGLVKPPSSRALKTIARGLTDPSLHVRQSSADAASLLGVPDPTLITGLKSMQTNTVDDLGVIKASVALWKTTKDRESTLRPVVTLLQNRLARPLDPMPKPGESGQGVSHGDQLFMNAAAMFREMKLQEPDRDSARILLQKWGQKSGRIFIEMSLLQTGMFELGLPEADCLRICREGLARTEDYYRIQAARLLATINDRFPIDDAILTPLLTDSDVNVRIHAAKIHWANHHDPKIATPILAEALDRQKHQSYWYEYNLPFAFETLRDIGSAARDAIPALEKAANDPNPKIVTLATAALLKIRQSNPN